MARYIKKFNEAWGSEYDDDSQWEQGSARRGTDFMHRSGKGVVADNAPDDDEWEKGSAKSGTDFMHSRGGGIVADDDGVITVNVTCPGEPGESCTPDGELLDQFLLDEFNELNIQYSNVRLSEGTLDADCMMTLTGLKSAIAKILVECYPNLNSVSEDENFAVFWDGTQEMLDALLNKAQM